MTANTVDDRRIFGVQRKHARDLLDELFDPRQLLEQKLLFPAGTFVGSLEVARAAQVLEGLWIFDYGR